MTYPNTGLALPADFSLADRARPRLAEMRALLRLGTPIALIALVNMGMSVTDATMVSTMFGANAFASVAVGSDLYSILFYLGAGTLAGLTPFYTSAVVHADPAERLRLERVGRAAALALALVLVPAVWTAPDWLGQLGVDATLLEEGRGYTQAIALTLAPMLGVVLYRTILTAAERPRVFLNVTLAMLPLNAVANYVLMAGAGPLPGLGPAGAGLSSLLVASASLALLMMLARRDARGTAARAALRAPVDWGGLATVLRIGIPIGITTVAEVGSFLGATVYAGTLGAAAVAAHTLTLRMAGIAFAVPTALMQAATVRMARAETRRGGKASRHVALATLASATLCGTVLSTMFVLAADPLTRGFFDTGSSANAAAATAADLLLLLAVIEPLGAFGAAASGLLRGRKDTRAPMVFTLTGHWAIGAPLGVYLCEWRNLGITGIWCGLAAGTLVTTVLVLLRLFLRMRGPGQDRLE
ncbi:MAG: hypothetical protein KDA73_15430 [Rhodobacteraceae bacterium]|nr:hypothetical protein [Paracoccaceae bacterium]